MRHLIPLVLACAPAAAGAPAKDPAPPAKTVTAKLEVLRSKHLAVQVHLNGEGPFRLLFDTGAPLMLVSVKAARKAGIGKKEGGAPGGFLGLGSFAVVDRVEIGGARAESLLAVVMDHPAVQALSTVAGDLDGIVGFSFFARFDTVIDYPGGTIAFTPNGYQPKDVLKTLPMQLAGRGGRKVQPRQALLGLALEEKEPVVRAVAAGGAAEAAGLKPGDRIVSLDGRWIETPRDVADAVSPLPAGEAAPVTVERGGDRRELTLVPRDGL